jgi:hypothetical protein
VQRYPCAERENQQGDRTADDVDNDILYFTVYIHGDAFNDWQDHPITDYCDRQPDNYIEDIFVNGCRKKCQLRGKIGNTTE